MADLLIEEELQILKRTVHTFVKQHVEAAEQLPGTYVKELPTEVVTRLQEKAKKFGLQAFGAKKEWGGSELSLNARAILFEEAAQHRLGLFHPAADAFGDEFPIFLEKCSEQQIEMYVKPAIKSGKSCFVALWEEQEDNHLEKLTTSAVKDGNEWIINGHKSYIQNFDKAEFGVILVNCKLENGKQEPTLFLL